MMFHALLLRAPLVRAFSNADVETPATPEYVSMTTLHMTYL